jgi:integrase
LKSDLQEGTYFPEKFAKSNDLTLRAWIQRCLDGSTNKNIVNEKHYGRRWSLWFGKRLLAQISTEELRRHQAKLHGKMKLNTKTKQPQRGWADSTVNRHFAFLRHMLMLALKDGKLTRNPVSGVKFLQEQKRTRYLTDTELTHLRQLLAPEHWTLVEFSIETGLRRAEQFRLQWDCVDLESGVITIPMPKGGRTCHVPLSDSSQAMLRSLDSFVRSPWAFPAPKNPLLPWNPQSFVNHIFSPA